LNGTDYKITLNMNTLLFFKDKNYFSQAKISKVFDFQNFNLEIFFLSSFLR